MKKTILLVLTLGITSLVHAQKTVFEDDFSKHSGSMSDSGPIKSTRWFSSGPQEKKINVKRSGYAEITDHSADDKYDYIYAPFQTVTLGDGEWIELSFEYAVVPGASGKKVQESVEGLAARLLLSPSDKPARDDKGYDLRIGTGGNLTYCVAEQPQYRKMLSGSLISLASEEMSPVVYRITRVDDRLQMTVTIDGKTKEVKDSEAILTFQFNIVCFSVREHAHVARIKNVRITTNSQ